MQNTNNFGMNLPEGNNVVDIDIINANTSLIDTGLSPFYVATLESANTYKINTGLNITTLSDGFSIKLAIPSDSNGAINIIVDNVTVPVKKPNGNPITNFKQNAIYTLTYYNSVFILASGGVDDVSFSASNLLENTSANDSNGERVNGTMKNRGAITTTLGINGTYVIPEGYHNGQGKITQSIPTLSAQTITPTTTNQTIAAGKYLSGIQTIKGDTNLIASNIISGKSIFGVNGTATIKSLGGYVCNKISIPSSWLTYENYSGIRSYICLNTNFNLGVNPIAIRFTGSVTCTRAGYDSKTFTVSGSGFTTPNSNNCGWYFSEGLGGGGFLTNGKVDSNHSHYICAVDDKNSGYMYNPVINSNAYVEYIY